jgi:hypothetical protein
MTSRQGCCCDYAQVDDLGRALLGPEHGHRRLDGRPPREAEQLGQRRLGFGQRGNDHADVEEGFAVHGPDLGTTGDPRPDERPDEPPD